MAITRFSPVSNMLSRWPSIWDDDDFELLNAPAHNNNLDIYETEDAVVVRANVAGVEVEDVDVTFEKGTLWIKASRAEEDTDEARTHYSKSSWSYSYKISVPGLIDMSAEPVAEVENGVINITFPKTEASKPRKVEVTAR